MPAVMVGRSKGKSLRRKGVFMLRRTRHVIGTKEYQRSTCLFLYCFFSSPLPLKSAQTYYGKGSRQPMNVRFPVLVPLNVLRHGARGFCFSAA